MATTSEDMNLIEIEPVEYQIKVGPRRNPRIIRYRKREPYLRKVTLEILKEIIDETPMQKKVNLKTYSSTKVAYKYGSKPELLFDLETYKIFVTPETFNQHGERSCQQQASILMRLLKKFYCIYFVRKSVTLNPNRIGKTPTDRKITYNAFEYLAKNMNWTVLSNCKSFSPDRRFAMIHNLI